MADPERGRQLLGILQKVTEATRSTIQAESPGLFDRAAIIARFNLPMRLFIENPAARALAKIGAARRLAWSTFFAAQEKWFIPGKNDELAGADPQLARKIDEAFGKVGEAARDASAAENRWYKLPENIVDTAVSEFFSGLVQTLEDWINFVARPFGIPWGGILLGLGVLVAVVLYRKAS